MYKLICCLGVLWILGCARVQVDTKPIKVDISMRVDVYEHVVKTVENIEDQVYGPPPVKLNWLFDDGLAYAADGASADVENAISLRKQRTEKVNQFMSAGYIGENRKAFLEKMANVTTVYDPEVERLIIEENRDRQIIYNSVAVQNNVAPEEIYYVFFKDHYQRAPAGWYFEVFNAASNTYVWRKK